MMQNPNIVSILKSLLVDAEAGKLAAFVYLGRFRDGAPTGGIAGGTPRHLRIEPSRADDLRASLEFDARVEDAAG
jgi:hypothetical protein